MKAPWLCVIFLLAMQSAWAIPIAVTLSGYLTDEEDVPLNDTFDARVAFYSTETSAEEITAFNITVTVENGVLSGLVFPTGDILLRDEVWYALAVDTDKNGITASDYFDDRFQLTSVPFSLTGRPVTFFETHYGSSVTG